MFVASVVPCLISPLSCILFVFQKIMGEWGFHVVHTILKWKSYLVHVPWGALSWCLEHLAKISKCKCILCFISFVLMHMFYVSNDYGGVMIPSFVHFVFKCKNYKTCTNIGEPLYFLLKHLFALIITSFVQIVYFWILDCLVFLVIFSCNSWILNVVWSPS